MVSDMVVMRTQISRLMFHHGIHKSKNAKQKGIKLYVEQRPHIYIAVNSYRGMYEVIICEIKSR